MTRGPTPFRFPVVGGLDPDLFRTGERVELDGHHGRVDLGTVEEVRVVTSFLERSDGTILLLRRSDKVGSFQGRWAAVSGFLEDPDPEQQARREIREETGIGSADLGRVVIGRRVYARDGDRVFTVHPFRFRVGHVNVRLDWEHTEAEWVRPTEIAARSTVPKLLDAWRAVRDDRPIQRSQTPKSRR